MPEDDVHETAGIKDCRPDNFQSLEGGLLRRRSGFVGSWERPELEPELELLRTALPFRLGN